MNSVKSYSSRSFIVIMLFIAFFLTAVGLAFYFGINSLCAKALIWANIDTSVSGIKDILDRIVLKQNELKLYVIGAFAMVSILLGLLLWFVLRLSFRGLAKQAAGQVAAVPRKRLQAETGRKDQMNRDRRMFLHLLSVLQREGRLVDFFAEDLSLYEDAQIGAAVRTIQEDCKKTINKYLAPKAVVDQPEGEEVTIEADFDPSAIKLTGNVTGEPPFKGILRHKGWQATKSDLPELSDSQDSKIISPAEVEIE